MKNKLMALFLISLFSFSFRFYRLSDFPVHLSMDEAAIAYNAYSIVNTGADEHNQILPLAFRSAGDYKPPVNVYLSAPFIKLFGLNEFGSRFVSAFLGSLTPLILFLLLLELKLTLLPSLLCALWLSLLPWHIHFSRGSFEAITALFFVFLGLLTFFRWLNHHHPVNLFFFIVSFCLAVWSYHAERLFIPLLSIFLIILYKDKLLALLHHTKRSWIIFTFLTFLMFSLPFIKLAFFSPAIMSRAAATSILREPNLVQSLHSSYDTLSQAVFDNNIFKIFNFWVNKYLNYFDPRFIFWKGLYFTPPEFPDLGLLYVIDIPLILLGFYQLIFSSSKKTIWLFIILFLLGPLPASFAMNNQHPLRALTWIPAFCLLIGYGFQFLLSRFHSRLLLPLLFLIYSISSLYFINIYRNLFPYFQSEYWQYGYKQAAQYVCQNHHKYNRVIVTDTFGSQGPLNTGLPYLYVLIACQYSPSDFKNTQKTYNIDYRRVDWKHDQNVKNMLVVASPWDILKDNIPEENIISQIKFKNGKTAFILFKTND